MLRKLQSPQSSQSPRYAWLAVLLSGLPFLSVLGTMGLIWPVAHLQLPSFVVIVISVPLYSLLYATVNIFFKYASVYLVISIIGLIVGFFALMWRHSSQRARIGAGITLVSILAFPFIYRYQPALTAAPGHKMQVVTQTNFIESILKATAKVSEEQPCSYRLMGWSHTNQLYYQSLCNSISQTWQYTPAQNGKPQQAIATPAELIQIEVPRTDVLTMVRAEGVGPKALEPSTRAVLLSTNQQNGHRSPDGQWVAIVTRHPYGPQDIILVGQ